MVTNGKSYRFERYAPGCLNILSQNSSAGTQGDKIKLKFNGELFL
jgi:hypothetical protein